MRWLRSYLSIRPIHKGVSLSHSVEELKEIRTAWWDMRKGSFLEKDHEESFTSKLEATARSISQKRHDPKAPWSPASSLDDQIRLALQHIEANRGREQAMNENLLLEECEIGTELLQMEARTPRYSPYRFPEREKLQRRLSRLAQERRRLMITEGEKLDTLHDRLLALLGKRRLLTFDQ